MGGVKQFIVFEVLLISMSLRMALDRTISARYLAHPEGDAEIFWWQSLLLLLVFTVGLYFVIREARQRGRAAEKGASGVTSGLLLVSSLGFGASLVLNAPKFMMQVSAPQVPLSVRLGYVSLTVLNLGAFLIWTGDNYRIWRSAHTRRVQARRLG